jgi:hypothetical protein
MEKKESETGAWRGRIEQAEVPDSTDKVIGQKGALSAEDAALVQDQEMTGETAVTEEGVGVIAGGESDGNVAKDEPTPMAAARPGVEESLEIYRGRVGFGTPTQEEISRRAYELYIERGRAPDCDQEDWLAAETELSQKYRDQRPA